LKNHIPLKEVYTIIVTFNGQKWIRKCLESLAHSTYPTKVIIIDNNSSDGTLQIISEFPNVLLLKQEYNLGFGKANNIGIQKAIELQAIYIFLLNQDTFIYTNTIESLILEAEKNPEFGIISPLHFSIDEKTLDNNFSTYLNRQIESKNEIKVVPFVNAAAWFLPIQCVKKVGFFEEWFSHYGEDRNYCNRVLFHNFKIGITEKSKIVHDRIIKRNFNKDKIQSKYSILATFLNVNQDLSTASCLAFKQVFGLSKYFITYYSFNKIINLLLTLISYYFELILNFKKIKQKRENY